MVDRFARQSILPEVGQDGQLRLGRAIYSPRSDASVWSQALSSRYALAAGWGAEGAPQVPQATPFDEWFRHRPAADVGLAAGHALSESLLELALPKPQDTSQ